MTNAVQFEHVSKTYQLGVTHGSLRHALQHGVAKVLRRSEQAEPDSLLWALRDVSFSLPTGAALGLIGSNGAGKTTILKLLTRVTRPSSGNIRTTGRIASLIELGAGFHPDLTGRENVFLNGAILGISRAQLRRNFDSIVDFAELERFIDTPVKRYSSGMYARLAFAVAAHVDPEILLVDEVLAVGDEAFQMKCFAFLHAFVKSGRTSVFVSHNAAAVELICDRVIWMAQGQIAQMGETAKVLRAYMDESDRRLASASHAVDESGIGKLRILRARVLDDVGQAREAFHSGEDIIVALDYECSDAVQRPYFCVWVSDAHSTTPLFAANMLLDDYDLPVLEGAGTLVCRFHAPPLMPKAYGIWVEAYGSDRIEVLVKWRMMGGFRIVDATQDGDLATARGVVRFSRSHGAVRIQNEWSSANALRSYSGETAQSTDECLP